MVGCVFSRVKPQRSTFLHVEKASAFSIAKNVELLGLYSIYAKHAAMLLPLIPRQKAPL